MKNLLNQQIENLAAQGLSYDQIAKIVNIEPDHVEFVLNGSEKDIDLENSPEKVRQIATQALVEIILRGDDNKDKIAAAAVLLKGSGQMPEINAEIYTKKFQQMKRIIQIADAVEELENV